MELNDIEFAEFEKATKPLIEYMKKWHSSPAHCCDGAMVIADDKCVRLYNNKMSLPYIALVYPENGR